MSAAKFLNEVGKTKSASGYINFDSLKQGKPYKISSFSAHKSNAFDKERTHVRAHIEDGYLILPERYDECYNKLKSLNIEKLHIIYNGRDGKRIDIDFEECDDDDNDSVNENGDSNNKKSNKRNKNIKINKNKRQRLE